jgi:para-nitrobenzyl esterase
MSEMRAAIVDTGSGKVEGEFRDGLYKFRGIPYAASPTGARRWLPPEPCEHWSGIRPAREFGNVAPQIVLPTAFADFNVEGIQDEDCLFLNVYTPGLDDRRRPVMVWIHGGAFNMGASSQANYDGSGLASRGDVVFVSLNYRLGTLGFLNLNNATGGAIPATGNEGLLDQIAALAWVRDNIAPFGGDPQNVTVFGESAGAMSIGCLLVMPEAQGLFHKAILQSGVANTAMPKDAAEWLGSQFVEVLGLDSHDTQGFRALSTGRLLDADMAVRTRLAGPGEIMRPTVTAPVIDGVFIPETPLDFLLAGRGAKVPVIIGTNRDEWLFFGSMSPGFPHMDEAGMWERINAFVPSTYAPRMVELYRRARRARNDADSPLDMVNAILSDFMFRMPAIDVLDVLKGREIPAYSYLFTWPSTAMEGMLGACHALEIGYVFGKLDPAFNGSGPEAEALSAKMQDGWIAFAKTGNPSCDSLGNWPEYDPMRSTMIFGNSCLVETSPLDEERRAWGPLGRGVSQSRGPMSLP